VKISLWRLLGKPVKFIVLFEDNPAVGADTRAKHMHEHLQFLQEHSNRVNAAGPLKTMDGVGAGGLWVVDANHESAVNELVKKDPFWPTGLRKSVRILEWTQVFSDGRALITP